MAAVFTAFDGPIYQRLIPQHLADLLCFPTPLLKHLKSGAFSKRITRSNGHGVGIDEAHEMKINKDSNFAVVRPSPETMKTIANFMPFRSKCLNNHLNMGKKLATIVPTSTSCDRTADTNITAMLDFMEECNMIPDSQ